MTISLLGASDSSPLALFLTAYLTIILALISIYSFFLLRKPIQPSDIIFKARDVAALIFCVGLSLSLYLRHIHDVSIWLDEHTEGQAVRSLENLLSRLATHQQQSPTSYLLRRFGLQIFGFNELGLRFTSALMAALAVGAFFVMIRKWTERTLFSLFSAGLFAVNFWMISYAVEARPYTISLFFELIFLFFLLDHPQTSKNRDFNLGLTISAFLWLCSVSMQPLAFICFSCGAFALLFFITKERLYRSALLSMGVAFFLFAPLMFYIVSRSSAYIAVSWPTPQELWQKIPSDLYTLGLVLGRKSNWEWPGLILVSAGLMVTLAKRKSLPWLPWLLFLGLGTALTLIAAFELRIQWMMSPRYLIFLVPIYLLTGCYTLFLGTKKFSSLITYGVFALLMGVCFLPETHPEVYRKSATAWRELYEHLDQNAEKGSLALMLSYHNPNEWDAEMFQASNWYSTKNITALPDIDEKGPPRSTAEQIELALQTHWEPKDIFLVHFQQPSRLHWQELIGSNVFTMISNDFAVIKIKNEFGLLKSLIPFFKTVESHLTPAPATIKIYDTLLVLGLSSADCAWVSRNLPIFMKLKDDFGDKYQKRAREHQKKYEILCSK